MKCERCGAELRPGATFCHECGNPTRVNNNNNNSSYVVIKGSEINLDEKTNAYRLSNEMLIKAVFMMAFSLVPIVPLVLAITIIPKYSEVKTYLVKYQFEKNILDAMITNNIKTKSVVSFVLAIMTLVFHIIALIVIILLFSAASRFMSYFRYF